MYLSIATTHTPATDLGFLLMKHPDRVHAVDLSFGSATVVFPEASAKRCEAALVLSVDPIGLVRGRGEGEGLLGHYVNDRPYAATSLLAVALNRAFRTAMAGTSRERPELAAAAIPLEVRITPLPGDADLVATLFHPLGWQSTCTPVPAVEDGASRYLDVTLRGMLRLSEALTHLYVLIPVMDADKHYFIGDDEVDKLLSKGGAWLAAHPARQIITERYLKRRQLLVRSALARLAPEEEVREAEPGSARPTRAAPEEVLEQPLRLADQRRAAVAAALEAVGAARVADLGCGEGRLLAHLAPDRRFTKLIGLDASTKALDLAERRLGLTRAGSVAAADNRITLLHGALTYRDSRWTEVDAVVLIEVIEHLDADRLPALEAVVFQAAHPPAVIVTTPNQEHNALFDSLPSGAFRHPDHRFEWTRPEFRAWAERVAVAHGYRWHWQPVGPEHDRYGPPTQMAVFQR